MRCDELFGVVDNGSLCSDSASDRGRLVVVSGMFLPLVIDLVSLDLRGSCRMSVIATKCE
jgi:hypothetical protein